MTLQIIKWDGKPITRPGLYSGIDLSIYHSAELFGEGVPALSSSDLRTAWRKSLKHMQHRWACNPDRDDDQEETKYMRLGRAAHHVLLGEEDFNGHYIMRPESYPDADGDMVPWQGNRKECKAWMRKQKAEGITVLLKDEFDKIRAMGHALADDPMVNSGLLQGSIECSMLAKDPETGIWLKSRPDAIPTAHGDYSDIKVTTDVTDIAVAQMLRNYGYHQQGALCWECAELLTMPFETFNLVLVENAKPHCVRIVPIDDDDISRGRFQNRAMIRQIANCIERGIWPGPGGDNPRKIGVPRQERLFIDRRLHEYGLIDMPNEDDYR